MGARAQGEGLYSHPRLQYVLAATKKCGGVKINCNTAFLSVLHAFEDRTGCRSCVLLTGSPDCSDTIELQALQRPLKIRAVSWPCVSADLRTPQLLFRSLSVELRPMRVLRQQS